MGVGASGPEGKEGRKTLAGYDIPELNLGALKGFIGIEIKDEVLGEMGVSLDLSLKSRHRQKYQC